VIIAAIGDTVGYDCLPHLAGSKELDSYVFLGDQLCPTTASFNRTTVIDQFRRVLEFVADQPTKRSIILGDCDVEYLWPNEADGLLDTEIAKAVEHDLQTAVEMGCAHLVVRISNHLFSHAGVHSQWIVDVRSQYGVAPGATPEQVSAAVLLGADKRLHPVRPQLLRHWSEDGERIDPLCCSLSALLSDPNPPPFNQVIGHHRVTSITEITRRYWEIKLCNCLPKTPAVGLVCT
jgi:hypothetical protein